MIFFLPQSSRFFASALLLHLFRTSNPLHGDSFRLPRLKTPSARPHRHFPAFSISSGRATFKLSDTDFPALQYLFDDLSLSHHLYIARFRLVSTSPLRAHNLSPWVAGAPGHCFTGFLPRSLSSHFFSPWLFFLFAFSSAHLPISLFFFFSFFFLFVWFTICIPTYLFRSSVFPLLTIKKQSTPNNFE